MSDAVGLKDFGVCFEVLMERLGFEDTLRETQQQLENYDKEIAAQEVTLYYQVRRETEIVERSSNSPRC